MGHGLGRGLRTLGPALMDKREEGRIGDRAAFLVVDALADRCIV